MRRFWICELKVDRIHIKAPVHWQIIRQTRLLGAVSGEGKKSFDFGVDRQGKTYNKLKLFSRNNGKGL
jgi:hypothetical protein